MSTLKVGTQRSILSKSIQCIEVELTTDRASESDTEFYSLRMHLHLQEKCEKKMFYKNQVTSRYPKSLILYIRECLRVSFQICTVPNSFYSICHVLY